MKKTTKGRNIQHVKPNKKKGKSGRAIKHKPQTDPITTNLWGMKY